MSQDQLNDLQPSDVPSQDNGHSEAQAQPPDPNQNIEQLDALVYETGGYPVGKKRLRLIISKQVSEAKIEAVTELKRRWNDDRKTMDYSPATYNFICDKYLAELKQTPPTPNGDEQGGLERPSDEK